MAITKILPVRGQLKGCLDYAANPQKTEYFSTADMQRLIGYTQNKDKTEHQLYVSGFNCMPQNAYCIIALLRRSAGRSIAGRVKLPLPIIRSKYRRSQPASESCGGRLPPVLTLRWTARWCRIRCKGRRIGGKTRPVKEYIAAPIDFSFFLI